MPINIPYSQPVKDSFYLKIAHLNVQRGIRNKKEQIEVFLEDEQPDVLMLSEHGLCENYLNSVAFDGFELQSSFCRKISVGGGVAIFSKFSSNIKVVSEKSLNHNFSIESNFEVTYFKAIVDSVFTIFATIYRPPYMDNFPTFFFKLEQFLNFIFRNSRNIVIGGDFNIDPNTHPREHAHFCHILNSFGLGEKIHIPTRISEHSESCLDNFLTNISDCDASVADPTISDHSAIILEIPVASNLRLRNNSVEFRDCSEPNVQELNFRLIRNDWNDLYSERSIDNKYNIFINTFIFYFNISCPVKKFLIKDCKKSKWITDEIIVLKSRLLDKFSEWRESRSLSTKLEYNKLKKDYRKRILSAKSNFISKEIESSKNPSKTTWTFVNDIRNKNKSSSNKNIALHLNGKLQSDPSIVSNIFNDLFSHTIDQNISFSLIQDETINNSVEAFSNFSTINKTQLKKVINDMPNKKSCGWDGISMNLLKKCYASLEMPLLHLINCSLESGIFPEKGKLAIIKPLHKKDDPHTPGNYRPVALLPSVSKILEKVVCNQLLTFIESKNLLFPNQFGYQKGKSTKLALINFVNKCIDAMEGGDVAIGCFIDLSKAFDCVNHSILFQKLCSLGITGTVLKWLKSYLSNRNQKTVVNFNDCNNIKKTVFSDVAPNHVGVPQGSILGPILFIIYINDIANSIPSDSLTIFADDTSLFTKNKNLQHLEQETFLLVNSLSQYFSEIDLNINPSKTNFIIFSTEQKRRVIEQRGVQLPSVLIGDELTEQSDTADYLGARLDGGLRWDEHVTRLATVLSKNNFVLRNIASLNNLRLSKIVYFSLIESHIRYSIVLWGLSSKKNLNKIFLIQKRSIRSILRLKPSDSCFEHFLNLNILTVPSLYMYETLSYIVDLKLFPAYTHHYNTRNRHLNPSVQHKLKVYEQKPEYVGIKLFSKLPENLKSLKDRPQKFKDELKKHLIEKRYYEIPDFFS